jgi:hypothetical protein
MRDDRMIQRLFRIVFRQQSPPPPPNRFSTVQVVEMAGGSVLAALILYIAHTVTSLPPRMTGMEQGQQQILGNQSRTEARIETILREQREQDRRIVRLENK